MHGKMLSHWISYHVAHSSMTAGYPSGGRSRGSPFSTLSWSVQAEGGLAEQASRAEDGKVHYLCTTPHD